MATGPFRIQVRRDTGANWTTSNPLLAEGELGFDLTAGQVKIGDGITLWSSLSYSGVGHFDIAGAAAAAQAAAQAFATGAVATETTRATGVEATKAPTASPTFTGTPTAPTPTALDNSTKVSTTAYADAAVAAEKTRALAAEALLAPKASPALTGIPTVPTAAALTNSTQAASTAYADAAVAVEATRATTAESSKASSTDTRFKAIRNITLPPPSGGDDAPILNTIFASALKGDSYEWNGNYQVNSIPIIIPPWTRHYTDGPPGTSGAYAGPNASANSLPALVVSQGWWNNATIIDNPIEISRLNFAPLSGSPQSGVAGCIFYNWHSIFEDIWVGNILNPNQFLGAFNLSSVNKAGLAGMSQTTASFTSGSTSITPTVTPANGTYLVYTPFGGIATGTTVTFTAGVGTLSANASTTMTNTTIYFVPSGGYVTSGTAVSNRITGGRVQYCVNTDGYRSLDPCQILTDVNFEDNEVAGGNMVNNALNVDCLAGWTIRNFHPFSYLQAAIKGTGGYGLSIRKVELDGWGEVGNGVTSASITLPQATIPVSSTAGWATSGTAIISGQTVTYTGITSQSLTGCTGGTGTFASGSYIVCQSITGATARGIDLTLTGSAFVMLDEIDTRHDVALVPGVSYEAIRLNAAAGSTSIPAHIHGCTIRPASSSELGIVLDDLGAGISGTQVDITANRSVGTITSPVTLRGTGSGVQAHASNSWQFASSAPAAGAWPPFTVINNTAMSEFSINFSTSAREWVFMSVGSYASCNGVAGQPNQVTVGALTGVTAVVGNWVFGIGIPAGTTISSIAGSTWTLSQNVSVGTAANITLTSWIWAPQYPNTISGFSANQVFRVGGNGPGWGSIFGTAIDIGAQLSAYKIYLNPQTKVSSYSMAYNDNLILASGASTIITLPDATLTFLSGSHSATKGAFGYWVKNVGTVAVIVNTVSSQTIDGGGTQISISPLQSTLFVSDGTNWWII